MKFLLLFFLLRSAETIDFRSQAYKTVESLATLHGSENVAQNNGNPYLQFTPIITQTPGTFATPSTNAPFVQQVSQAASNTIVPPTQQAPYVAPTSYVSPMRSVSPTQYNGAANVVPTTPSPAAPAPYVAPYVSSSSYPAAQAAASILASSTYDNSKVVNTNLLNSGGFSESQPSYMNVKQTNGQISFPITELIKPNYTQMQEDNEQRSWISSSGSRPAPVNYNSILSTSAPYVTTKFTTATTTKKYVPPSSTVTPMIWTTKATTRQAPKMSKLSVRPLKKEDNGAAAHVSVPSHRLLNDILVIPSSRRLYILAIIPIHESADNKGFECGRVDVNGFIRLAAFLDALNEVNNHNILKDAGLSLGAVIVDSCSSDLRTVADLYELLSGTNIQKTDLVAMVRDDGSYLPNVDDFAQHLKIPIINTFFAAREHRLATGTLPSMSSPLEAMLGLLHHTGSSCVTLIYDDLHEESSRQLLELAVGRGICLEQRLCLSGGDKTLSESVVRRMLLTEARVAIVLLGEGNWIHLMKAFRTEMVIAGRFILLTPQDSRWFTSKQFKESWPHFDQLLLTVAAKKPAQAQQLAHLTTQFPQFPFPQHWLRQFWSTAFKCHIEGETENGEQFSKECSHKQILNLTAVAPDIDISPITLAVHSIAHATRKLVDNVCPGALVQSLNDCMNEPQESLFGAVLSLRFTHSLAEGEVSFNETSGYRDSGMVINRVMFDSQLEYDQLGEWDTISGFVYTAAMDLVMEERDGSRAPLKSTCPKSSCASALALQSKSGKSPSFRESLNNAYLLFYAIGAVLAFFICLMCMYHQIVGAKSDPYRICTIITFGGLASLCLVSMLFVMPPNAVSCAGRRVAFSISLAAVFAPVLVKTLAVWRLELTSLRASDLTLVAYKGQTTLFWISIGLILIQTVISTEWALFEAPTQLAFTSSVSHGYQWRCAPGDKFEQRLLNSCAFSGMMIIVSLVCSILSVKHVESRQNILISVLSGFFAIGLYVGLPLIPFSLRDQVIAGALLSFSFLVLLITYCRGAFLRPEKDSSRGSLMDKSTMDRSEKVFQNPFWLDNHILSPRGHTMTLQKNYHQAATLPQQRLNENYGLGGYTTPGPTGNHIQRGNSMQGLNLLGLDPSGIVPRISIPGHGRGPSQHKYGVDSYELPDSPLHHLPSNISSSKYGKQEFVLEEDGEDTRL